MEKMTTKINILCLSLAAIVALTATPAYCSRGYVLLVEQTPIEGGTITPGVGVHTYAIGDQVTVTAVPKPGYQFVRWMGDVGSTDTSRTTVTLDSPKMLVAIFEKSEYALPFAQGQAGVLDASEDVQAPGSGPGSQGTVAHSVAIGGGGGVSPASGSSDGTTYAASSNSEFDGKIDVPGPEVPEPATLALMGIGGTIALLRRRI